MIEIIISIHYHFTVNENIALTNMIYQVKEVILKILGSALNGLENETIHKRSSEIIRNFSFKYETFDYDTEPYNFCFYAVTTQITCPQRTNVLLNYLCQRLNALSFKQ